MSGKNLEPKPFWANMQDMPTGQYTRRLESDNFKKQWSGKMAVEWLEWQAKQRGFSIRHQYNNTEKRIGARRLPVDGFSAETQHQCFNFMVCCFSEIG